MGISTQKLVKKNVSGIGFALSATDLLNVLRRFYPEVEANSRATVAANESTGTSSRPKMVTAADRSVGNGSTDAGSEGLPEARALKRAGIGTVMVTSDPDGAELFVDDKFVGNSPAKLKLAAGPHTIVLRCKECVEWKREIEVIKDSVVNLDGMLTAE